MKSKIIITTTEPPPTTNRVCAGSSAYGRAHKTLLTAVGPDSNHRGQANLNKTPSVNVCLNIVFIQVIFDNL